MSVLIAYDVSDEAQKEVKEALENHKFFDFWIDSNNTRCELPDTTLYNEHMSHPVQAKRVFTNVIDELNKNRPVDNKIKVLKFIAVISNELVGI